MSFTLDRYGHLHPEADTVLRDRLDALHGTAQPAPTSLVVRLPWRPAVASAWPQVASGNAPSRSPSVPPV